jgi:hypothetical protein
MACGYELGVVTVAAASGAAYCTIHTGATRRLRLWEVGFFSAAGTVASVGIGTPANTPVATTSVLGATLQVNDPTSTVDVDTAWSTAPTTPAKFFRQITLPATAGSGCIWVFQRPILIAVSSWLCLWNFGAATGPILDGYFSWEEE